MNYALPWKWSLTNGASGYDISDRDGNIMFQVPSRELANQIIRSVNSEPIHQSCLNALKGLRWQTACNPFRKADVAILASENALPKLQENEN